MLAFWAEKPRVDVSDENVVHTALLLTTRKEKCLCKRVRKNSEPLIIIRVDEGTERNRFEWVQMEPVRGARPCIGTLI
jgi:hypothetical protein